MRIVCINKSRGAFGFTYATAQPHTPLSRSQSEHPTHTPTPMPVAQKAGEMQIFSKFQAVLSLDWAPLALALPLPLATTVTN